MNKISPCLWFDSRAEQAARFYTSVFKNSKVGQITRYGKSGSAGSGQPEGSVMTVSFTLDGQPFLALNGGPGFKFTWAVSFIVNCETQAEVDEMWAKLSEGGEEVQCGWLKDRFGLSWQVVPTAMLGLVGGPDPVKAERAMKAMLKMKKLDINVVQKAYDGE